MFKPKEMPNITKDVVINDNIFVVAKVLHLKNDEDEFIFENNSWHVKTNDGNFANLGIGAVPNFILEERIEAECFDDFFEQEQIENLHI